jgi:geranylgeranyl diphosphate synthase type II
MEISSQKLEQALNEAFERHLSGTPPNLAQSMAYSLLAPGKRIRPRLLLACARMTGLSPEAALPPALALEMVHCFTLIHDDLPCMDDDDFRRGRPSNHRQFGEAVALLAGDALVPLAIQVFLDAASLVPPPRLLAALRTFVWAMGPSGVIGGQAAEALLDAGSPLEEIERMHARKTGALFSAALLIPRDLAGISDIEPRGRAIARFAADRGLACQVADDLEDAATEQKDPTSILSRLSPAQARDRTLARMDASRMELSAQWGEAAGPLIQILEEVRASLVRFSEAPGP